MRNRDLFPDKAKEMHTHTLRLMPGQDLKHSLDRLAGAERWPAACILTGVGSLRRATIRFANEEAAEDLEGPFEIVALSGTLSQDGSHLHILLSDRNGVARGGHLKEGAIVNTTAEIVIGILAGWQFARTIDPVTGSLELTAERHSPEV